MRGFRGSSRRLVEVKTGTSCNLWVWVWLASFVLIFWDRSWAAASTESLKEGRGGSAADPRLRLSEECDESSAIAAFEQIPQGERTKSSLAAQVDVAIRRGWWSLARQIIGIAQKADADISAEVRKAAQSSKTSADALIRLLDATPQRKQLVSPAFQWTQSEDFVYILVKLAFRWSSPGALGAEKVNVTISDCCLHFEGIGTKSHADKMYVLDLSFFAPIDKDAAEWSSASVGKYQFTLKKQTSEEWPTLEKATEKKSNGHIWWEMKERIEAGKAKSDDKTGKTEGTAAAADSEQNATTPDARKPSKPARSSAAAAPDRAPPPAGTGATGGSTNGSFMDFIRGGWGSLKKSLQQGAASSGDGRSREL